MYLTVNEISKALGIPTETIRYYVREGIITPRKNKENNYWEYSSDDLIKLTDILFYRNVSFTIQDIKAIMTENVPLEGISSMIDRKKNELIDEIQRSVASLHELQDWSEHLQREMARVGEYYIDAMPVSYRRKGKYEEAQHIAHYLGKSFDFDKGDWGDVSVSFTFNVNDPQPKLERYVSFSGSLKLKSTNLSAEVIAEKEDKCLITEVHYSDDPMEMCKGLLDYAKENNIKLTGTVYGRENTNYYVDGRRMSMYCLYAVISKK